MISECVPFGIIRLWCWNPASNTLLNRVLNHWLASKGFPRYGTWSIACGPAPPELHRKVMEALTTNETSFFREVRVFEMLRRSHFGHHHFSIWISAFPGHATILDELLRAADQALYNAKRQGRDEVVVGTDAFVLCSR